jgi:hypothetical protein
LRTRKTKVSSPSASRTSSGSERGQQGEQRDHRRPGPRPRRLQAFRGPGDLRRPRAGVRQRAARPASAGPGPRAGSGNRRRTSRATSRRRWRSSTGSRARPSCTSR